MLVNVKFFKDISIFLILISLANNLYANEKKQIINQLINLNALEFTFKQIVNEKTENGGCLLEFPGKLKCNYFDDKQKELVINDKKLAITQKRYDKTYRYPISKSPFLNILYKDKLFKIINSGKLKKENNKIKLHYLNENEITIFFDNKTLNLVGWKIIDQYNNNIDFSIKIISKNDSYDENTFNLPKLD